MIQDIKIGLRGRRENDMTYPPKTNSVKNCVIDLKKILALPPYDTPSNFVAHDGYFSNHIDKIYSKRVRALAEKKLATGE